MAAISLIVVVTAATFARVVGNEFVSWDDRQTIAENPRVTSPSRAGVAHNWRHAAGGLYVPVTYTYWSLLALIAGPDARVYHAASIVLHACAALLAFCVARQLTDSDAAACVGALVFAVHPVQVESVAWASGAKDVLAGAFALATIDQFLRYAAKRQAGGGRAHYAASLVLFVLATLSKPSAVVAPVIALVLVRWKQRARLNTLVAPLAPMLIVALACALWSRAAQAQYAPTETPLWTRPLVALDAIAFYLWKLVWPANLTIIYGRTPRAVLDSGVAYYTALVPVVIGVIAWTLRHRVRWLWIGLATFVIGLLPVLGFARFMFQIHSTVADHYLYLPLLGVALAVAGVVSHRRSALAVGCAAGVIVALSLVTYQQVRHWRDSESLYARVLAINPNSAFARAGLGRAYAESNRIPDAIRQFEAAVQLAPTSRTAHAALAQAYLLDGRPHDAAKHARVALSLAAPGDDASWERYILDRAMQSTTQPAP